MIKSEKKRIKCSIFGRERVSEAIGQNLQVWAAGMTVTPEREESVDFTDTYANATQVVIVRK